MQRLLVRTLGERTRDFLDSPHGEDAERYQEEAYDLLASIISDHAGEHRASALGASYLLAAKQYIQQHLDEPALSCERVAAATATFLASEQALQPLLERLQSLDGEAQKAETVAQLGEPLAALEAMAGDLDMLSSLMASLRIDDATQRTRIIESISEIYARLNQAKRAPSSAAKGLGSSETVAQFGAQFKLFGQGITNALAQAQDPERCDEQLSRLLVQLEELESQFGDHEQFLGDILAKRESCWKPSKRTSRPCSTSASARPRDCSTPPGEFSTACNDAPRASPRRRN